MDQKQSQEAFNQNIPEGYNTGTYIIVCPVCSKEIQAAQGSVICPDCGAELEFSIEEK